MEKNPALSGDFYAIDPAEALKKLESNERGLSESDVKARLARYGENKLPEAKQDSVFSIFLRQFKSPIIYILLAAAGVVLIMGSVVDAGVIAAVLLINAIVGSIQEGRAQNTLAALKKMVETSAVALRDGKETIIPARELVPGDIILLAEGDKVPADVRLVESESLRVDESALTGESNPIHKTSDAIRKKDLPSPDQKNMAFRGTYVVGGAAKAVVVKTGGNTVIGSISEKLGELDTDVPLKASIAKLSRVIIAVVLSTCALLFAIGIARGLEAREMFTTAVAMAVSATPEGLPVVVTIVLAAGMYRMSRQNALVRKLQAVEALGQASYIAVDKTGTVTLNQMSIEKVYAGGKAYDVTGSGYEPKGAVMEEGKAVEALERDELLMLGKAAAFCASASVAYSEETKEWRRISGDPTEAALLVFSEKIGFSKEALEREHRRVADIPFSSDTKYHATLHERSGKIDMFVAGAPETVIENSRKALWSGKAEKMSAKIREEIEGAMLSMSRLGLRVVALAVKEDNGPEFTPGELPELCFVGLVGIADSIRPEASAALAKAREAGVKVVMITGDFPETAKAIAQKVGIYQDGDEVMTGKELATLSDEELSARLKKVSVFARVVPEDKLKIVEAYRKRKEIIAMTGDGVNDALSLAAADLGVSMGKIGTEVAKEASDIVLLDDNFGSIVSAIEEGRNVYRSIKKVLLYLFSTSMGEVLTITFAIIAGLPLPLLATQIIWMNFVTDGFIVAALGLEPKEKGLLAIPRSRSGLVDKTMALRIALMGTTIMASAITLFYAYLPESYAKATTMALAVLAMSQWWNAFNSRSESRSLFGGGRFGNPYLLVAVVVVVALQMLAVYAPFFQKILQTAPLELSDWAIVFGMSLAVVIVEEARKAIVRFARHKKANLKTV